MSNALGAVPMMPMALANSACEDEKDGSASTAITITISLGEEVGERERERVTVNWRLRAKILDTQWVNMAYTGVNKPGRIHSGITRNLKRQGYT